ncbi:MAG: hypothetical protein EYC68_21540 [Chloroflexota bacterium]|nr:MAG: hypothetical protein EYC68_21540 [Chloroflexota bacterium]
MAATTKLPDFVTAPPKGWIGAAVVVGISLLTNITSALAQILLENSAVWLMLLAVSIVLAVVGLFLLSRLRPQRVELKMTTPGMQPIKYPGLVVLVGPGRVDADPTKQAAWTAIEYHRNLENGTPNLRVCWIITSGGTDGGLPIANRLKEELETKGIVALVRVVNDAFNIRETFDVVQNIYQNEAPSRGLTSRLVISDFTGATKPMTAGMVLACGAEYPMQYVFGGRNIASEPVAMRFA